MKRLLYFLLFLNLLACTKTTELPVIESILADYILSNQDFPLVKDSLIACAFGGEGNFLESEGNPISILFYPEGTASEFKYFETDSIEVNADDLSNYHLKELSISPVFNGYLQRFERAESSRNLWGRVTFVKNNRLHISNAIRLKFNDKPTEFSSTLLSIDQSAKLSPSFSWSDGQIRENVIYFHAILDDKNNLVSGTYTFDRRFQFYNLSNVVLNIRDVMPPPVLLSGNDYQFILMGVSVDNWVNLILSTSFKATP